MSAVPPLVDVAGLDFAYPQGDFRLRVPRLAVAPGEKLAVVGASGSGKTTLLEIVAGILTPAGGTVSVAGAEVTAMDDGARRRFRIGHVGLVFQSFELLEYLTVRDNVLLPFRLHPGLPWPADAEHRLARLAAETGIEDRLERYPARLSQGERQRVAICRALIANPDLILADEPTGNLDPDSKQRVLEVLAEQVSRRDATLVMVTHDRDLLAPFDRVLDMVDLARAAPA